MRHVLIGITVLLVGVMALPAFAADDKDKKDPVPDVKKDADKDSKDPAPDAKKDADKDKKDEPVAGEAIKLPPVPGKLVEVNESAKSIKLEITTQVSKPNYGEMQALQNCKIQLAQTLRTPERS